MKKLLSFLTLLWLMSLSAQSLQTYEYVIVPTKFSDFKENQYQLNLYLKQLLRKHDFQILSDKLETWPQEVRINPCLALTTDIKKTKHLMKNGLELIFYNCKKEVLQIGQGISHEKDFEKGYQEALKTAYSMIHFGETTQMMTTSNEVVEEIIMNEEIKPELTTSVKTVNSPTVFIYKDKQYIQIGEGNAFSLVSSETGRYYARFIPSSIENVYHVLLYDQSENTQFKETLGFYDGKVLKIEQPLSEQRWQLLEFQLAK